MGWMQLGWMQLGSGVVVVVARRYPTTGIDRFEYVTVSRSH
jgi:hypothetical protein